MSVITKGKTFANGEQLTAGKLNQMLDAATFSAAAVDNTKTTLSGGAITIAPNAITATEIAQSFLDTIYPIGSIYTNATDSTNPGTLLGFGTWVQFAAGRMMLGFGQGTDTRGDTVNFNSVGDTSGEYQHVLQLSAMPKHDHVPNRNSRDTANLLLTRRSDGGGTTGGTDTTVGEVSVAGNYGLPEEQGNNQAHNNMPPYIVVYMWKRTA